MEFIRVGEKVLSLEKLEKTIKKIIKMRADGSTQSEISKRLGVDRSFISHLEGLGEVRKGLKTALVAFPVRNKKEITKLANKSGIDFSLIMSQEERVELVENANGAEVFNEVMDILSELVEYDLIILMASDLRIKQAEKILGEQKVVGIQIGKTPIRRDVQVDVKEIKPLIKSIIHEKRGGRDETRSKRKFRFFKKKPFRRK